MSPRTREARLRGENFWEEGLREDFFFDFRCLDAAVFETGMNTPQHGVSSAGLRLLSLSPDSFCVLPSPDLLRPRHDDRVAKST
jgi:hypothetical protein